MVTSASRYACPMEYMVERFGHRPFKAKGGRIRVRDLASMAVQALGIGSSITFRRYLSEDKFGPLKVYRDEGVLWAEYVGGGKDVK